MNDKINLLQELGFSLTPRTLAAIVADLNSYEGGRMSHNLIMALDTMVQQGEANVGPNDFALMVVEAEADRMAR